MKEIPSYMEKRYNIQRQLGAGSYGTVFLGVKKATNEKYLQIISYYIVWPSNTCTMFSITRKMPFDLFEKSLLCANAIIPTFARL